MGIYDRDYMHQGNQRPMRTMPRRKRSAVFIIIVLNVVIWLVNAFVFMPPGAQFGEDFKDLNDYMGLRVSDIHHPLQYYRFITSGFAHSPDPSHIIGNMLVLFFLGPHVERLFGRRTFFIFYFLAIISGGIFWCTSMNLFPPVLADGSPLPQEFLNSITCVGASGAVTAVVILFAINYPRAMVLLFFVIPMPVWLLGVMFVAYDLYYAYVGGTGIAHTAHLGGAAFALLFALVYKPLRRLFTGTFFRGKILSRGDHLRIYNPEPEFQRDPNRMYQDVPPPRDVPQRSQQEIEDEQNFHRIKDEVERILRKMATSGQDSLTHAERQTLLEASEIYKRYNNR